MINNSTKKGLIWVAKAFFSLFFEKKAIGSDTKSLFRGFFVRSSTYHMIVVPRYYHTGSSSFSSPYLRETKRKREMVSKQKDI